MQAEIQGLVSRNPVDFLFPASVFEDANEADGWASRQYVKAVREGQVDTSRPPVMLPGRKAFAIMGARRGRYLGSECVTGPNLLKPGGDLGLQMWKGMQFVHQETRPGLSDAVMILVSGPRSYCRSRISCLRPGQYVDSQVPFYAHWARGDGTIKRRPMATAGPNKVFAARSGLACVYIEEYMDSSPDRPEGHLHVSALLIEFKVLARLSDKPDVVSYKASEVCVHRDDRHMDPREAILKNATRNQGAKHPNLLRRVTAAQRGYIEAGLSAPPMNAK
ncbi:hypothetical protein HOI18_03230 [Candidatus Uhrbacteria bacterium]|nr:hypothetical protein [Candidatus Uhrbacteria bacterium]